jgi:hypothetical protein
LFCAFRQCKTTAAAAPCVPQRSQR